MNIAAQWGGKPSASARPPPEPSAFAGQAPFKGAPLRTFLET